MKYGIPFLSGVLLAALPTFAHLAVYIEDSNPGYDGTLKNLGDSTCFTFMEESAVFNAF